MGVTKRQFTEHQIKKERPTCETCNGRGRVEDPDTKSSYIPFDAMMPCPECEGEEIERRLDR